MQQTPTRSVHVMAISANKNIPFEENLDSLIDNTNDSSTNSTSIDQRNNTKNGYLALPTSGIFNLNYVKIVYICTFYMYYVYCIYKAVK